MEYQICFRDGAGEVKFYYDGKGTVTFPKDLDEVVAGDIAFVMLSLEKYNRLNRYPRNKFAL